MSDIAIRVENLSKKYTIGASTVSSRHTTFRDQITYGLKDLFRRNRNGSQEVTENNDNTLWALKDITFEIKHGDVVGIIGRNGAGKSTLLKVLSRITTPTSGTLEINGRVGSLLEVGTGFHPELSGRENVFLNGAILGMKKAETARKFDEIVAFAEVEKFIDTPVKRYSSGMYVRLAFSVAAHLEPEILIVDEALSVGDASFQRKCLKKMESLARSGRTVLFVSHSMAAVQRLCQRGILLEQGQIRMDAGIIDASNRYMQSDMRNWSEQRWDDIQKAPGDDISRLRAVRVIQNGELADTVDIRLPITIEMEYLKLHGEARLSPIFSFINDQGNNLFVSFDLHAEWDESGSTGIYRSRCTVPGNFFTEGQVRVCAEVSTRPPNYRIHFNEFDSVCFQVEDKGTPGSVRHSWGRELPGLIRPELEWESEFIGTEQSELQLQLR